MQIKYSKRGFRQPSPVAAALHRTDKREIMSLQICFSFPTDDTTSYVKEAEVPNDQLKVTVFVDGKTKLA